MPVIVFDKEELVPNKKIIYQGNTYMLQDGCEKLHEEETGRENENIVVLLVENFIQLDP